MDMEQKKQIEKFQHDYDEIFSKGAWDPQQVCLMKDLQKLMYYIEVRDAMKEGSEDNWNPNERSYRGGQPRNPSNGQYMSRGGSGHYPMGDYYYDNMGGSGRRYYDSDRENALSRMRHLMETETNPEARNAIQMAIHELEMK